MLPVVQSLFTAPGAESGEVFTILASGGSFRLEHIASYGAVTPVGFWYDQDDPEWVALVQGTASIEFQEGTLHLKAGDSLEIPPHLKHRVTATSPDAVWIALHFANQIV